MHTLCLTTADDGIFKNIIYYLNDMMRCPGYKQANNKKEINIEQDKRIQAINKIFIARTS